MNILVINNDWRTKPLAIKNKTTRTLSDGRTVPTWNAMVRQAAKV